LLRRTDEYVDFYFFIFSESPQFSKITQVYRTAELNSSVS